MLITQSSTTNNQQYTKTIGILLMSSGEGDKNERTINQLSAHKKA